MKNGRVSPDGKAMGKVASRLAELGRARLTSLGLDAVKAPMLREEMCRTCACQLGTVPNGCLQTQLDFLKSAHEGIPFRCHAPMDGKVCAGWKLVRAQLAAHPLPRQVTKLLDRWDYSPPDNSSQE